LTRVLFYRDYQRFTGGQLKVWDYFNHVRTAPGCTAQICFSPESVWDADNPWLPVRSECLTAWNPGAADFLFLAGHDWEALTPAQRADPPAPILNLIQHPRHAGRARRLAGHLEHPAVRICVSEEVADALHATGRANGPVVVIPNGIAQADLPPALPEAAREPGVAVFGLKNPGLAQAVARRLQRAGVPARLVTKRLPRSDFLRLLSRARVAVFAPNESEGFYLPALEAMALGALVVCPDCFGNRSFCRPEVNCFRPDYGEEPLFRAAREAAALPPARRAALLAGAAETAAQHTLERERSLFQELLRDLARARQQA
jgi:hypothetical protein